MIRQPTSKDAVATDNTGVGLAIGLAIGAGLGVVFGIALDNMAFMSIGVGAGMCIGLAIGAGLDGRAKAETMARGRAERDEIGYL